MCMLQNLSEVIGSQNIEILSILEACLQVHAAELSEVIGFSKSCNIQNLFSAAISHDGSVCIIHCDCGSTAH